MHSKQARDRWRRRCGCSSMVALCLSGGACVRAEDSAVQRASREAQCPIEKVHVVSREDVREDLFDVEACGFRARYACDPDDEPLFGAPGPAGPFGGNCVREPNPPVWNPDPAVVSVVPDEPQRLARVCRDEMDDDCLAPVNGAWAWRRTYRGSLVQP